MEPHFGDHGRRHQRGLLKNKRLLLSTSVNVSASLGLPVEDERGRCPRRYGPGDGFAVEKRSLTLVNGNIQASAQECLRMSSDLFQEWRAADRMALTAERAVVAESLRAIAGTGSLPTEEARAKAKNLRATADDLFRVSMDEMSARVNELRR